MILEFIIYGVVNGRLARSMLVKHGVICKWPWQMAVANINRFVHQLQHSEGMRPVCASTELLFPL